jgi:hypothetical protein
MVMARHIGITEEGVQLALDIKRSYRNGHPLCLPGHNDRMLVPEHLLNHHLDLAAFDDPLPLAVVATRDPDSPMALSAAVRLSPRAADRKLVGAVFEIIGEKSRHREVKACVDLVNEHDFSPEVIAALRRRASVIIVQTRKQYTAALRQNLQALLEGAIAPRDFVHEFFELTEAGSLRHDIRKKLLSSLLMSENVRPSIKFLFLENFGRLPTPVRCGLIADLLRAKPSPHVEIIKEELKWIVRQERTAAETAAVSATRSAA